MDIQTRRRVVFILSCCALPACALAVLVSAARADDSSMGATGGTVYPMRSADIRMEAETVQAVCFGSFAEYRVDFRFVNAGKSRKVMLGFPFVSDHGNRPVGFQAWQDGRPLAIRALPARPDWDVGPSRQGFFVHSAVFPRGPTMITVSYLCQPSGSARGRRPDGDPRDGMEHHYEYWLHSGATWSGTIGRAIVRYQLADSFTGVGIDLTEDEADEGVPVTSPPGWSNPTPGTYQWQFTDFEPAPRKTQYWRRGSPFDVTLGFSQPYGRQALDAKWTWSSAAKGFGDKKWSPVQDRSLESCWADGAPGDGAGQWLEAQFKKPVHLRELRLVSGNNEYPWSFSEFARPRKVTAVFSDGSTSVLRLDDAPGLQRFPVNVTTTSVRFAIDSVYHGTDYRAACVSEIEFGTARAPAYAAFGALMLDPSVTGRVLASAGSASRTVMSRAERGSWERFDEAERYGCGDLIGVGSWQPFPADFAPFKEPSSLEAVAAGNPDVLLPEEPRVGKVTQVSALSDWSFEIRYASGIDLLVNTALSRVPSRSVIAELAEEAEHMEVAYADGRKAPYEVMTEGMLVLGVARGGEIDAESSSDYDAPAGAKRVPAQVFWRDGDVSYHLYARQESVSTEKLLAVARAMIKPATLVPLPAASENAGSSGLPSWAVALIAALLAAAVLGVVALLARRRSGEGSGETARDGVSEV